MKLTFMPQTAVPLGYKLVRYIATVEVRTEEGDKLVGVIPVPHYPHALETWREWVTEVIEKGQP